MRGRGILAAVLLFILAPPLSGEAGESGRQSSPPSGETESPLSRGNRLFRNGQIEDALAAYEGGWDPRDPDPTLAYNAGTAAHHLGFLPEALLWYRRASLHMSDDPWLTDNLALARASLGWSRLPPRTAASWCARHERWFTFTGVLLAWLTLLLTLLPRQVPLPFLAAPWVFSLLFFGTGWAVHRLGPQPAVLLAECGTEPHLLPAGTEIWVLPSPRGGWILPDAPGEGRCPSDSVGLVRP